MRNVIYSIGIASFLACMTFTIATSLTNPFYGMSEAALAQASSNNCNFSMTSGPPTFATTGVSRHDTCLRGKCEVIAHVLYASFMINGQLQWKKVLPNVEVRYAVSFKYETEKEEQIVYGSHYVCDQTNNKNCWIVACY